LYPAVRAAEEWQGYAGYLVAWSIVCKLIYIIGLVFQLRQVDVPKEPADKPADSAPKADPAPPAHTPSATHQSVCPTLTTVVTAGRLAQNPIKQSKSSNQHLNKAKPQTAGFVFKDCSFTVMVKKKDEKQKVPKKLIDHVSGSVNCGSVLAIMGPSGAGKTTLLNMLMLDDVGGHPTGHVTLAGNPFTLDMYQQHACVVQQTDTLWWPLNPRDHIHYAVRLYHPDWSMEEQEEQVSELIQKTGLESCQNTKAGNVLFKGLSGGQKRRLSLAIALAKHPRVIFLDEPTSGLDAAAAASVTHYLKAVAQVEGLSILCTIHQPSTAVFKGFDNVLFLTGGRTAYIGPAIEVSSFLGSIGKPVPADANPADFMLDLINKDFGDEAAMEEVVSAWKEKQPAVTLPAVEVLEPRKMSGVWVQARTLFGKAMRLLVLDALAYVVRMVGFLSGTCFFAAVYSSSRDLIQTEVTNRVWFVMWLAGFPTALGVVLIYVVNNDYQVVKREVKDGMYRPINYVIAQFALQLPMIVIMALFILVPAGYPIGNWEFSQFYRFFVITIVTLASFEFMAEFFAVVFANALIGMLSFLGLWFTSFLFCGILVNEEDVPWPIRTFSYILPLRWTFGHCVWALYLDTPDYDGAETCKTDGTTESSPGVFVDCPDGFFCPGDSTGTQCFGKTGTQILSTLSDQYAAIDDPNDGDTLGKNIGIIVAVAFFFKAAYFGVFLFKSVSSKAPSPPA